MNIGDIRIETKYAWIPTFVNTNMGKKLIWLKEYKAKEILEVKIHASALGISGAMVHYVNSWTTIDKTL